MDKIEVVVVGNNMFFFIIWRDVYIVLLYYEFFSVFGFLFCLDLNMGMRENIFKILVLVVVVVILVGIIFWRLEIR